MTARRMADWLSRPEFMPGQAVEVVDCYFGEYPLSFNAEPGDRPTTRCSPHATASTIERLIRVHTPVALT